MLARLAILITLVLCMGCGRQPKPPRNVFLITIDTLRSDHMSVYGYPRETTPRIRDLAGDGVVFEQAIAQWPVTGASMASMFIGQYPQTTGITHKSAVELPSEFLTLPELFEVIGFQTVAVVSNGVLSKELGWNAGFDEFVETWPEGGFPEAPRKIRELLYAGRVNELAFPLLERHARAEPLFAWIHYSDPHTPYMLPEGEANPFLGDEHYLGSSTVDIDKIREIDRLGEHRDLKYYVAQYDANIRIVDQAIRDLLDHAGDLGLLEDSLVVIAADHGESLGEHGLYFGHGPLPYNTTAHVPLIFHYPGGFEAGRIQQPVELVDLYPTLLDLVDPERVVPGLEGQSLVSLLVGGSARDGQDLAFAQAGSFAYSRDQANTHFRSVQDGAWKLIYHPSVAHDGELVPARYELYHLERDPLETNNLASQRPKELRRLRRHLFAWMNGNWIFAGRDYASEHSEKTIAALRALGYME